ncbi:MAG TPA: translation initiation factor IF-3, partial [Pseudolabrys sp.]
MRRPMKSALPAQKDGPRINEEIRAKEVQLIDSTGDNKGVVDFQTAMGMAEAAGLDLVEISPN